MKSHYIFPVPETWGLLEMSPWFFVCLLVFGGWQSRFFSCLWKDYTVIRGGPPHNYYIKEHTFSNKPCRQWQGTTKRRQMKILHKRHLKIHIKAHQPFPNVSPFTSISAGNTLAVVISDLGCQRGQNSQKSFPKMYGAEEPAEDNSQCLVYTVSSFRSAMSQSQGVFCTHLSS